MAEEAQGAKQLTVAEAAKYFHRSQQTIRKWVQDGTLIAANNTVIREKPGNWTIIVREE